MIDTITGLHRMHHGDRHALLHRDLKPKNMLVFSRRDEVSGAADASASAGSGAGTGELGARSTPLDSFVSIKLGDLGLARELEDTLQSREQSAVGTGTLLTMAPEVMGGDYSPAGDVFSWGVTMCMVACLALSDPPRALGSTRAAITGAALGLLRGQQRVVAALVEECMELYDTRRPCSTEARDRLLLASGLWLELGGCVSFFCSMALWLPEYLTVQRTCCFELP
jgi:serine/threonine protein kinase